MIKLYFIYIYFVTNSRLEFNFIPLFNKFLLKLSGNIICYFYFPGQLISIRSNSALYGTSKSRELKVWSECDDVQDYVTVYDGYTTRDPVILKFCGGGEPVPEAGSSGHELLVEFTTSPFGTFLHPTPIQSLHGFQLEVEVGDLLFLS